MASPKQRQEGEHSLQTSISLPWAQDNEKQSWTNAEKRQCVALCCSLPDCSTLLDLAVVGSIRLSLVQPPTLPSFTKLSFDSACFCGTWLLYCLNIGMKLEAINVYALLLMYTCYTVGIYTVFLMKTYTAVHSVEDSVCVIFHYPVQKLKPPLKS